MLLDLQDRASFNSKSVLNQCNLSPSMNAVKDWLMEGEDPVVITRKSRESCDKKCFYYVLKPKVVDFSCDQPFVFYPNLLPTLGLVRHPKRTIWVEGEDMLV